MRAFKHVDPSILLPSFLSFYRSVISEEVRPPSFFEPTTLFSFIPRNSLEHNKIRFSGRIRIHRCFTRTRILWFFAILLSITMVLANMTYTNNIAGGRQYVRALVHITDINNSGVFFNAILVLIPVIPVIHVSLDALNVRWRRQPVPAPIKWGMKSHFHSQVMGYLSERIEQHFPTCTYLLSCFCSCALFQELFGCIDLLDCSLPIGHLLLLLLNRFPTFLLLAVSGGYNSVQFDTEKPLLIISLNLHLSTIKY